MFWTSHGMIVYYVATEWFCFIIPNIYRKQNSYLRLPVWPKLPHTQTNRISSHLLCSVVSTQQNATNSVFLCSFMMNDFSLSFLSPPPLRPQLNQIHFLCRTTVFKRTARTDACQVFPDAPKQWLHSWQIPLILNLIRH